MSHTRGPSHMTGCMHGGIVHICTCLNFYAVYSSVMAALAGLFSLVNPLTAELDSEKKHVQNM